jgi:ZIP family zinc transporter
MMENILVQYTGANLILQISGVESLFRSLVGTNPVIQGLAGGLVIAGLNTLGALLILVWRNPSERSLDGALGFAAGVMLAASFTSLILPAINDYSGGRVGPAVLGIILGALVLDQGDKWVPHIHQVITGHIDDDDLTTDGGVGETTTRGQAVDGRVMTVVVFIIAITLHNMPEGLAVGVAFGSGDLGNAIPLMIGIGIQNIPEGLAVAIAARQAGLGDLFYAGVTGIRAGLVEIPIAVFGAAAVALAAPLVPYAMGFAAGGMLYVIVDEIVPETHERGNERAANLALIAGLIIMLSLDVVLG